MNTCPRNNFFLFLPEYRTNNFVQTKNNTALEIVIRDLKNNQKTIAIIGGPGMKQLDLFENDETYRKNNSHLFGFSSDGIEAYFSCYMVELTMKRELRSLYEIELDISFDDGAYMVRALYDFRTRKGVIQHC